MKNPFTNLFALCFYKIYDTFHARGLKKVVAFSLWSDSPKYCVGAVRNADLAAIHYPGWECWFYCDESVPPAVVAQLESRANVRVIPCAAESPEKPGYHEKHPGLFWRFQAPADPRVGVVICRDTDSRISRREVLAVNAWLESGSRFHIMRDHPLHRAKILGGMWGCKAPLLRDIGLRIEKYKTSPHYIRGEFATYGADQDFLQTIVWPLVGDTALVHDEIVEKATPFPEARTGSEFVGQVYDEHDEPNAYYAEVLMKQGVSG